jgi:hypothetical protein
MTVASHIVELKKKHEHLSDMVQQAQRSPATDDLHVSDLKKQKMKIKEEITRLQQA